jgi:hypothetical protein
MKPVTPAAAAVAAAVAKEGIELVVVGNKGMEVDEEGYPRPMPDPGTDIAKPKLGKEGGEDGEEGWRWSTKEWVQRVEELYWVGEGGLLTPPGSPGGGVGSEQAKEVGEADNLAERICRDVEETLGAQGRWEFLRTRFRKVEGDVLGGEGGVTLEAVKW